MSRTKINCNICNKEHEIATKEYNRQIRNGRNVFYCSSSCSAKQLNKILTKEQKLKRAQKCVITATKNNTLIRNKKGKFTWYLNRIRQRHKGGELINEQILQSLWDKQQGKCAITGINLELKYYKNKNKPYTASVDRINSSFDYTPENIQFVSYSINLAKNSFSDAEIIEFIKMIRCQPHESM